MVAGLVASQGGHGPRGAVRGGGLCHGGLNGKRERGKGKRPCPSPPASHVWCAASSALRITMRISSIAERRATPRCSVSGSTSRSSSSRREKVCAAASVQQGGRHVTNRGASARLDGLRA